MNMVSPFNFDPFFSRTIGFEHIFERLNNIAEENLGAVGAYPPYNINRHSDGRFDIEIAVAGFTEEDLDVEYKDSTLTKGKEKIKNQKITSTKVSLIGASGESSTSRTTQNRQGLVSKTGSSPFIWKKLFQKN